MLNVAVDRLEGGPSNRYPTMNPNVEKLAAMDHSGIRTMIVFNDRLRSEMAMAAVRLGPVLS